MKNFNLQRYWRYLFASLLLLLTACAGTNTFTVQQEVFQQLGGAKPGGSYAIRSSDDQSLEHKTYAGLLQRNMYKTGLYQAVSEKSADYLVDFYYTGERRQRLVRDYHYDPVYIPYMSYFYGPRGRLYSRVMYYPTMHQSSSMRQVNYNYYTLRVLISRRADGQSVYQSTVAANSQSPLSQVMPYLTAAVFDGYPGQNAQIREVAFDLSEPGAGLGLSGGMQNQMDESVASPVTP